MSLQLGGGVGVGLRKPGTVNRGVQRCLAPSSAPGGSRQRGAAEMQDASEAEIPSFPRDTMLNELLWLIIHSSWLWVGLLQCVRGKDMPKEGMWLGG